MGSAENEQKSAFKWDYSYKRIMLEFRSTMNSYN